MRARILHWYSNCLSGGSVAHAVLGLAESQAGLGAEVVVAAADSSGPLLYGSPARSGGATILAWRPPWRCACGGVVLRGVPGEAIRRLRAFGPDVVHAHGAFNPENLWVPFLIERPIVFSPHGGFHPDVFAKRRRVAKHLYFDLERRWLHSRVRAFHALSSAEAADIVRLLPAGRVYCVPQAPNMSEELSRAVEAPAPFDNRVTYVFVGRLDIFTKGLDILLDAFADVERRLPGREVTLMLVGPDCRGSLAWLRRRSEELGVARRVVLTGAVSSREVVSVLRRSDVYVQLSRHDGFPSSVSEAFLAGKMVILSRAVGHAAYAEIASLPHVRVVPPRAGEAAAAMVEFAHRIGELASIAERCRAQLADFFSWDRIAGLHLQTYEDLIAGAPRSETDAVRQGAGP